MDAQQINQNQLFPSESELPPDYPVYASYAYVIEADGKYVPVSSPLEGSAGQLAAELHAERVFRCDLSARGLL